MKYFLVALLLCSVLCSYCFAEGNLRLLKARNPQIGQKGKLAQNLQDFKALEPVVEKIVKARQQRVEEGTRVQLTQEDLDVLHDFVLNHAQSEAGLTAKFVLGVLLARDTDSESWNDAVPILGDLSTTFPDTWQGCLATILMTRINREMAERQTGTADPALVNAEQDALQRSLEKARQLDESQDAVIRLVRILFTGNPRVTFVISIMEALDKVRDQQLTAQEGQVAGEASTDAKQRPKLFPNLRKHQRD